MEYVQALGWLEEQENGKDAAEAIRTHVSSLNKESQNWRQKYKGATAEVSQLTEQNTASVNEADTLKAQIQSLQSDLAIAKSDVQTATNKLKGLETDTNDGKTKFEKAEADLKTATDKIKELETSLGEKTNAYTQLEVQNRDLNRNVSLTEAATTGGVHPTVLKKLVSENQNLVVEGSSVFVVEGENKTSLREYADANWKEFVPALFNTGGTTPRLPNGSPAMAAPESKSVVKKTLDAIYGSKK